MTSVVMLGLKSGFNTQPRGGGCKIAGKFAQVFMRFNTQPRGGGCVETHRLRSPHHCVSTHSRAEAAAFSVAA